LNIVYKPVCYWGIECINPMCLSKSQWENEETGKKKLLLRSALSGAHT